MTTTTSVPTATSNSKSKPNNNSSTTTATTTTTTTTSTTVNSNNISSDSSKNNVTSKTDKKNIGTGMKQSSSTAEAAATTTTTTKTLTVTTTTTSTTTATAASVATVSLAAATTATIMPATLLTRTESLTTPPLTNRAVTITPILNPNLTSSSLNNSQNNFTRTMQSDEDFNIKFVNLVRLHKCLYDKKVPEYRNRDNQEKAWVQISRETKENVIHCKERWRNLRACLSRYIKQQTGNDPQHKPYYLTEHMAFLLPFLKSTRNSLDGNNSLAALFQFSQQQHLQNQNNSISTTLQMLAQPHLKFNDNNHQQEQLEVKHSLSDNEDEETIDAFDPAVTASMHMHQQSNHHHDRDSPPLSDTASANTMQNFIPDVQLSELRTPDGVAAQDIAYVNTHLRRDSISLQHHHHNHEFGHEPKRIKTECHASEATTTAQLHMYAGEHADMEFFRSILPDIAGLTPHQKRKLKIGILELIDDVVERYPLERSTNTTNVTSQSANVNTKTRSSSSRDWRK